MANGYLDDISGIFTEEPTPASADVSAADLLAEQMRQEEAALAAALPTQRAEAELARQDWIERGRPEITAPVQMGAGQVMPTSRGFMYVGQGIAPPEGGPLAAQRAYESAVLRQNVPEAGAAYNRMAEMGIQPPTGPYTGTMNVPMPMATPGEQRAEVLNRFFRATGAGIAPPEARAMSGYDLIPQGRYGQMTEFQRLSNVARNREIDLAEKRAGTAAAALVQKPGIDAKKTELAKLNTDILKTESEMAAMPSATGMPDWRSELLGVWKSRKRQLESELAPPPASIAPPATAATATAPAPMPAKPVPAKKSDLVTGQIYDTKRGKARWDGEKFVPVR